MFNIKIDTFHFNLVSKNMGKIIINIIKLSFYEFAKWRNELC